MAVPVHGVAELITHEVSLIEKKNRADRLGSVCHGKLNCSAEPSL